MFKIGDIVEWTGASASGYINCFGIVQGVTSLYGIITVSWFDDGTINNYREEDLKLVQRV